MTSLAMFEGMIDADNEGKKKWIASRDMFGLWQGMLRVVGSFGDCPRCLAVCPVGNDYHAHLAKVHKKIPEKTPEKVAKGKAFKAARQEGKPTSGLSDHNIRWVGEDGYQGIVARQLKAFRDAQQARANDHEEDQHS